MSTRTVAPVFTRAEADALWTAADAGTADGADDQLQWHPATRAAFDRAMEKLAAALARDG